MTGRTQSCPYCVLPVCIDRPIVEIPARVVFIYP